MNHKRHRPKHQRAGCLLCKPHKDERAAKMPRSPAAVAVLTERPQRDHSLFYIWDDWARVGGIVFDADESHAIAMLEYDWEDDGCFGACPGCEWCAPSTIAPTPLTAPLAEFR